MSAVSEAAKANKREYNRAWSRTPKARAAQAVRDRRKWTALKADPEAHAEYLLARKVKS